MRIQRIDIPDCPAVEVPDVAFEAADVVIESLRRCGVDPAKALANPMMRQVCIAWARGEMSDAQFHRSCRNMLILNPSLGLKEGPC